MIIYACDTCETTDQSARIFENEDEHICEMCLEDEVNTYINATPVLESYPVITGDPATPASGCCVHCEQPAILKDADTGDTYCEDCVREALEDYVIDNDVVEIWEAITGTELEEIA